MVLSARIEWKRGIRGEGGAGGAGALRRNGFDIWWVTYNCKFARG